MTDKPIFEHDCDECVFLGNHNGQDLYVHSKPTTVIARYGKDGDYSSGLPFSYGSDKNLTEARNRAEAQGLLEPTGDLGWK